MIHNKTARRLLYAWHGGQWSPEYAAASSGLVDNFSDLRYSLNKSALDTDSVYYKQQIATLINWLNVQEKKAPIGKASDGKTYAFLPWATEEPKQ